MTENQEVVFTHLQIIKIVDVILWLQFMEHIFSSIIKSAVSFNNVAGTS